MNINKLGADHRVVVNNFITSCDNVLRLIPNTGDGIWHKIKSFSKVLETEELGKKLAKARKEAYEI